MGYENAGPARVTGRFDDRDLLKARVKLLTGLKITVKDIAADCVVSVGTIAGIRKEFLEATKMSTNGNSLAIKQLISGRWA